VQEGKIILRVLRAAEILSRLPHVGWGITGRSPAPRKRPTLEPCWLSHGVNLELRFALCKPWLGSGNRPFMILQTGVAVWPWQPDCLRETRHCKLARSVGPSCQILDAEKGVWLASFENCLSLRNEGKCSASADITLNLLPEGKMWMQNQGFH